MALINCPECSHGISTKAKTCPNCGAVLKGRSYVGVAFLVAFWLYAVWVGFAAVVSAVGGQFLGMTTLVVAMVLGFAAVLTNRR